MAKTKRRFVTKEDEDLCLNCGKREAVTEAGFCEDCIEKGELMFPSEAKIVPAGTSDTTRPEWHKQVYGSG